MSTVDSARTRNGDDGILAGDAPKAGAEAETGHPSTFDKATPQSASATVEESAETSLTCGSGSTGTLFDQPSDPASNAPTAPDERDGSQDDFFGECFEPAAADEDRNGAEADPQDKAGEAHVSPLSHLKAQAASRLTSVQEFLGSLREWCHRHAAPRLDGDEVEMSWTEALVETAARVAVVVRHCHMRALIVLFLLFAGLYSTWGVPIFGPSVNLGVWPLQAVSVAFIWIGLAVPWARGHSFGSMFKDGALSDSGESVDVLVPSVLLIALGGASYSVSAMLMGAGSSSWGLSKVMIFFAVSALATATAAYETAAVSRRAGQSERCCEA